jgi:hypothetical protein
MRIILESWGLEPPQGQKGGSTLFRRHLEDMRELRRSHDSIKGNKQPHPPEAGAPAAETQKQLETLLKISYVLNLVRARGGTLLPRNWQN